MTITEVTAYETVKILDGKTEIVVTSSKDRESISIGYGNGNLALVTFTREQAKCIAGIFLQEWV